METILWLMRHGEAEDPDQAASDERRALTSRGLQTVTAAGQWLASREAAPDQVWHSPYRRTTETAHLMAESWSPPCPIETSLQMAPGMTSERLLTNLSARKGSRFLCVGHQPDIGRAISECIGGGKFSISPGTIAAISFRDAVVPGSGQLLWVATPDWFAS